MMKFIVSSQLLSKNLQNVTGIITTSKNMPIIENVLFTIEGFKLTLTATDLETTVTSEIELSESEGDGSIVIPAKLIVETIKTMADIPVIFNISENYSVEIVAGDAVYNLIGWDADQFPQKIEMGNINTFNISSEHLINAISSTAFATGNAEMRPVMAGVFCQLMPDDITFVATDAHRLVRYKNNTVKPGIEAPLIIPKKPLLLLKNIIPPNQEDISIAFDDLRVSFKVASMSITSKLIEGKYPNYEAVIPNNNTNVLQIDRLELLQKMRNISLYANQSTHQVRLKIEAAKLTLTAEDIDYSTKATVNIPCVFECEEEVFEIGFSSKFLQEMLSNLTTQEVIFKFSHPTAAGLIFEIKEEQTEEDLLMLIMPVMLNN
ncbi:MAG TPA: DNA polymerase III subunit beta [Bacteroidales bacterium]|nr:DNA polymerase III subunit beta [Bacteroidales bacterium]